MKKLPVDNLSFVEIGGVGEMIYRAIRFPEYVPEEDDELIKPVFSGINAPTINDEYNRGLTGQELLISLINLYRKLNRPFNREPIAWLISRWCKDNIHPYEIEGLYELLESEIYAHVTYDFLFTLDGTFVVKDFTDDLYKLGRVFDFYFALKRLKEYGETEHARELYYEGRLCDGFPFFERYRSIESDEEYREKVMVDFDHLTNKLLDLFPDFNMRLKLDKKTSKVMFGADIQSVFDIAWYTLSRLVADVAPSLDDDLRYFESQGSVLSCLACGEYFVRHSGRQLYCQSENCQAERNRKNRRASYARKKARELDQKKKN